MEKKIKLLQKINEKKVIPIFFATDDNYIPFLDVAIRSIIDNASKNYKYEINVLNTGLLQENIDKIMANENENFTINFRNVTEFIEPVKSKLRNVYHFSLVTWYRLFIETMFPKYDKVLYMDCDIVVLGDISKLYNTILGINLLGAVRDQVIVNEPAFVDYVKNAVGVQPNKYFNAGILLMNLKGFRSAKIQDKFVYLINEYNFDVVDPDQAYLNFLCRNRVKYLPTGWNKASLPEKPEGKLNLVHFNLYKKPWQVDDVINGEYFWKYAKQSPFYSKIVDTKDAFDEVKRIQKEQAGVEIVEHARVIAGSNKTFKKCLLDKPEPIFKKLIESEFECKDESETVGV